MADGPGGTEVGRVYIRVLPNTAEFAAKLKAAIKGMSDNVEVGVNVNTTRAKAQIAELTRRSEITLIADADTKAAEAKIKRVEQSRRMRMLVDANIQDASNRIDSLVREKRQAVLRVMLEQNEARAQLAALDRTREAVIEAHISDQSIAKAEARIQSLNRRRDLVLNLDTKQVTKRYNRLKAQMRHLTSQLNIETEPAVLERIRAQLAEVTRGFTLMGDIKLKGREEVAAQLEALKRRYEVVIEARSSHVDRALTRIETRMEAMRERANITVDVDFNSAEVTAQWESIQSQLQDLELRVITEMDDGRAFMEYEAYKQKFEDIRAEIIPTLNDLYAKAETEELRAWINRKRVEIVASINTKLATAQLAMMERDYTLHLNAELEDKAARVSIENLARDRDTYFKAVLDTKKAMVQFSALERDRVAELHIELRDSLKAQAELIRLGRRRSVEFGVELDRSAKAEAELAWLTRDRTLHVNVKTDLKTKLFDRFNGQLRKSNGLLGNLGTTASGVGRLLGGVVAQGVGRLTNMIGRSGDAMIEVGQTMVSSVTTSMGTFISSAAMAAVSVAALAAIGGVAIAIFAGLGAAILAVAAALVGMALAVAMLAVTLIGAAVAVAALAAVPLAFGAAALFMVKQNEKLHKSFKELEATFKRVMERSMKPLIDEFAKQMPKLENWLEGMEKDFQGAFKAASKHLDTFRVAIQKFVENILPGITKGMNDVNFQKFMDSLSGVGKELGLFGKIGKAIGDSFAILASNGDKFAVVVGEIGRGIGVVLPALARFLSSLATGAQATGQIADGVGGMFDELAESFNVALASDGWKSTVAGISDMMTAFGDAIGEGFEVAMQHGEEFKSAFSALGEFMQGIAGPLAEFTGSAAGQFGKVMPSVTEGMAQIIPAMQKFTEAFAVFAPDVVSHISDAIAELFNYLARPDVAEKCAEITKAFVDLAQTVLGPATLDAILGITTVVLDFLNLIAPLIPLLIQFFLVSKGFQMAGVLAMGFGKNLSLVGTALSGASGSAGRFGTALASMGTKLTTLGTTLKGGLVGTFTSIGSAAGKIGPKLATIGKGFGTAVAGFAKGGARMIATLGQILARTVVFALRMAAQWLIAMGPIGWIALAVAAIVALIIVYWDEIVAAAKIAWDWIYTNVVQPVLEWIVAAFQGFVAFIVAAWNGIVAAAQAVWNWILGIIQTVINWIMLRVTIMRVFFATAWALILAVVRTVWDWIKEKIGAVYDWIKNAMSIVGQWIADKWNTVKTRAINAWNLLKAGVQLVIDRIRDFVSRMVTAVVEKWNQIKEKAGLVWNWIKEKVSSVGSGIRDAIGNAIDWVVDKFNALKDTGKNVLNAINPANWFSAPLGLDVSMPSVGAFSVPVTFAASATTFASSDMNPLRKDFRTLASGIDQTDSAYNMGLAISGALTSGNSEAPTSSARNNSGVTVNVETNANPFQIGKEVAWALRRK